MRASSWRIRGKIVPICMVILFGDLLIRHMFPVNGKG